MTTRIGAATDGAGLRSIVESLVKTAKSMEESNKALESKLKNSKQEINDLHAHLQAVHTESLTDPLTTLANRKHFDACVTAPIAEANAKGEHAVAGDVRHRSFQDLQRHLRPSDRRSGAAAGGACRSRTTSRAAISPRAMAARSSRSSCRTRRCDRPPPSAEHIRRAVMGTRTDEAFDRRESRTHHRCRSALPRCIAAKQPRACSSGPTTASTPPSATAATG